MRRKEKELPFLGVFFPPLLLLWVVFLLLSLLLQHPWFLIWVRVEAEGNATISASAEGTFFRLLHCRSSWHRNKVSAQKRELLFLSLSVCTVKYGKRNLCS